MSLFRDLKIDGGVAPEQQSLTPLSGPDIMVKVCNKLAQIYGEEARQSWFEHLSFAWQAGGAVTISAATKFIKEWVSINYCDTILKMWKQYDNSVHAVELQVVQQYIRESSATSRIQMNENVMYESVEPSNTVKSSIQIPASAPGKNLLTFDNFVIAKSNEVAAAACYRVASSMCPDKMSNPLFIYGGVGLGKTHLMHSIEFHVANNMPWKKVLYLTAENFMREFISAMREKRSRLFQDELRSADILIIDDIQFISGKDHTQEEFFHTFNDLMDGGRQLVISADRTPNELSSITDRIKSRLSWGLIVNIEETTFELRVSILQKKLELMKETLSNEVVEYLAHNVTSNIRELEGALNKLMITAKIKSRQITLDFAADVLSNIKTPKRLLITPEIVQKKVAIAYGITLVDLCSAKRKAGIVRPRQIAMYLLKQLTTMSLLDIGRQFGGRNHTTVMHSIKRMEDMIARDRGFADEMGSLVSKITSNYD